jgi:hypothetical protein
MLVVDALGELLEEPPPQAVTIMAAMTAAQVPAIKIPRFMARSHPCDR